MRTVSRLTKEDIEDLIKSFIARHRLKIQIVFSVLLVILFVLILNLINYLGKPASVTLEYKKSGDDVFKGYSIYLDDGQPTMGIVKDGEICKTIPIEREEYDSIMAVDFKNDVKTRIDLAGMFGNASVRTTVKDHMGRETVKDDYMFWFEKKLGDLIIKYVKTDDRV